MQFCKDEEQVTAINACVEQYNVCIEFLACVLKPNKSQLNLSPPVLLCILYSNSTHTIGVANFQMTCCKRQ